MPAPRPITPSRTRSRGAPQPEQDALHALARAAGHLRRRSDAHLARYGVSPAQWGVLRALERLDHAGRAQPRMHELGEALLVHPPSLSATLDRMERDGLVRRRADPDDHRTRRVGLTPAGRALLADAQTSHNLWIRAVMGGISHQKLRQLTRLLSDLTTHMEHLADPPTGESPRRRGRSSRSDA